MIKLNALYFAVLNAALLVSGCSSENISPLLYTVKTESFAITVPAKGEMFSAKATIINAPMSSNGGQILAWLAPEFSIVKKGDVIALFDGEAMQEQSRNKEKDLALTQQDIIEKSGGLKKDLNNIKKDIVMVAQEKNFAEKFSIDDESIRSKLEILDAMQNTEYLGTKQSYLNWKSDSFSESSQGDLGLLEMRQQQFQSKLTQLSSSLSKLEIKAPHDGLLVYKSNWRGEKPRVGKSLWPGQKIGALPDTSVMKAKLFIRESEAIDLVPGIKVHFHLNAYADKLFKGEIDTIAAFPKSIKRGDPQKYFEVSVKLANQNQALFMPGRKIEADILVADKSDKMIIPLQSVFAKDNKSFVYVFDKGVFSQVEIQVGQTSLSHIEVTAGLSNGQKISLTDREKG